MRTTGIWLFYDNSYNHRQWWSCGTLRIEYRRDPPFWVAAIAKMLE
jgi:hypothetical protein